MEYGYVILFFPCVCLSQIIQSTEEFENALKEMRFLKGDTTDLLKYARNINSHFANKKCQDVIVAARTLMTSEIHNTLKVLGLSCVTSCLGSRSFLREIRQNGRATNAELTGRSYSSCKMSSLVQVALLPAPFMEYCGAQRG